MNYLSYPLITSTAWQILIVIRTCFRMGLKYKKASSVSRKIDHKIGSFSLARSGSKPGDWKVREEVLMLIKRSTDDYQFKSCILC